MTGGWGDSLAGETIAGRYTLRGIIRREGAATVYRAYQAGLDREVAVTLFAPAQPADPGAIERFRLAARRAARLRHPSILATYEAGAANGRPYLVTELSDGEPLASRLDRPLAPSAALTLLDQLGQGLDHAHAQGVAHLRLNPANVLLDGDRALIGGFGEAALAGEPPTGTAMAEYLAPEQRIAGQAADGSADRYALGVIAYRLLVTGRTTDATLMATVRRAMARRPEDRYPTAAAFLAALRGALADQTTAPLPTYRAAESEASTRPSSAGGTIPPPPISVPDRRIDIWAALQQRRPSLLQGARLVVGRDPLLWGLAALLVLVLLGGGAVALARMRASGETSTASAGANPGGGTSPAPSVAALATATTRTLAPTTGVDRTFPTATLAPPTATAQPTATATLRPTPTDIPRSLGATSVTSPPTSSPATATPPSAPSPTRPPTATAQPTITATRPPTATVRPTLPPSAPPAAPASGASAVAGGAIRSLPGTASGVFTNLANPADTAAIGGDQVMPAASLIKLPIAGAAYQQVALGQWTLKDTFTLTEAAKTGGTGILQGRPAGSTYTLDELVEIMLVYSDNTAANMIVDRLGGFQPVNSFSAAQGMPNTVMRRKLNDLAAIERGLDNTTTANDIARYLARLQAGQLVNAHFSVRIKAILTRRGQEDKNWSLLNLPSGQVAAHITGTGTTVRNDALLITGGGRQYLLVLLVKDAGGGEMEQAIARVSATVYQAAAGTSSPTAQATTDRWQGTVGWSYRAGGTKVELALDRAKSNSGEVVGDIKYPDLGCSGTLTLAGNSPTSYILTQKITSGKCLEETLTIVVTAAGVSDPWQEVKLEIASSCCGDTIGAGPLTRVAASATGVLDTLRAMPPGAKNRRAPAARC